MSFTISTLEDKSSYASSELSLLGGVVIALSGKSMMVVE